MSAYVPQFNFTGSRSVIIGDDFLHQFTFQDSAGVPITQDGTFYAQIRKKDVLIADFVCVITGGSSETVELTIPYTVTLLLEPVKGANWDLEHHTAGGLRYTLIGGLVDIVRSVTEVP